MTKWINYGLRNNTHSTAGILYRIHESSLLLVFLSRICYWLFFISVVLSKYYHLRDMFLLLIMCKHAIVIYCLLSQPSLIPNFFTCSHASSLALFPIESLHKVTFEERTATRTGHFILKQSTREKHLTSGYCPSLKKQCFPQFLDDFSGPFNVVRLLLQCLFFSFSFYKFCLGHFTNVTLAGSSSEKNNFLYIYA